MNYSWELFPGRFEYELRSLEEAGIPFEVDRKALLNERFEINLEHTVNGKDLKLKAIFPSLYPYTRFEVFTNDIEPNRHQHPFGKNLCLIPRGTRYWSVEDTLAEIIKTRLPDIIELAQREDPSTLAEVEELQGNPYTDYYSYADGSNVFVDSAWELDDPVRSGKLLIGVSQNAGILLRGTVLEVRDAKSRKLANADYVLAKLFPNILDGRWVRIDHPISENNPEKFLKELEKEHSHLMRPLWQKVNNGRIDIIGVVFKVEIGKTEKEGILRPEYGDGWLFVVRAEIHKKHRNKKRKPTIHREREDYLARAERAGIEDLAHRIPELRNLREKKIAVIGLGSLGAPSVLEFARSGVGEIRVVDNDIVDAGPIVRWPFGISMVGAPKVNALEYFIANNYPYTKVRIWRHQIGGLRNNGKSEIGILDELFDGVDFIFDATGELGIQHLLADMARKYNVPYLCVSITEGAWGGLVTLFGQRKLKGVGFAHNMLLRMELFRFLLEIHTVKFSRLDARTLPLQGLRLILGKLR